MLKYRHVLADTANEEIKDLAVFILTDEPYIQILPVRYWVLLSDTDEGVDSLEGFVLYGNRMLSAERIAEVEPSWRLYSYIDHSMAGEDNITAIYNAALYEVAQELELPETEEDDA